MKRLSVILLLFFTVNAGHCMAGDLDRIRKEGVLRHLGVPYANFVITEERGLDIELMRLFAAHLGVEYRYVQTTWQEVIPDLIGHSVTINGEEVVRGDKMPVKGDVIANGLTIIPWRLKLVAYSQPTFPNQIWLVAESHSQLTPVKPSGNVETDIKTVKALVKNVSILGKKGTCLEHSLYCFKEAGAITVEFKGGLNELAPALLQGEADTTILDVPDALVALEKWPGRIKIIGPISPQQQMAVAFRPESHELLREFNLFYDKIQGDGTYQQLIKKYYPTVFEYFPEFFAQ